MMDENIIWQFLMGRAETLEQTSGEAMEDALAALADTVIFDAETQHAGIIYNNRRVRLQQDGVPKGIRTPVIAVKGRCPRPLDDGDMEANKPYLEQQSIWWSQTGSNRRPPACHAGALPAELWPRLTKTSILKNYRSPVNPSLTDIF